MSIDSIDVFSSSKSFQEEDLRNKTAVIVDVLRATSTITTAIANGAKGVVPVEDMGDASKIAQNLDSAGYLLCGEKNGVKIEGYQLGNSPLEYKRDIVENKTLILNTTNGTEAISRSSLADNIIIASFLNLKHIVDLLRSQGNEVVIVCAGWRGRLCLEDSLCAGQIVHELFGGSLPNDARDGAKVAFGLYEKYGDDLEGVIGKSNHAVRLKEIIGNEDVAYCCKINSCKVVPAMNDGIITDIYGKE